MNILFLIDLKNSVDFPLNPNTSLDRLEYSQTTPSSTQFLEVYKPKI